MSQEPTQPKPTAPDIRIVKSEDGWEADPDELTVVQGSQDVVVIVGPGSPRLEGAWFKNFEHAWLFGATEVPAFPADDRGRIEFNVKDAEPGEYPYSFRIGGETFDPKIIIEPPTPPN